MDNKPLNENEVNNTPNVNSEQVPVVENPTTNLQGENQTTPVVEPSNEVPVSNEVKIINGEIELKIEEPKQEEKVVEEPVKEVKESKRLVPFMRNDDLLLLVMGIVLVIGALNLGTLYDLFSNKKFKLDPTPVTPGTSTGGENNGETTNVKEYTLVCSKKNDVNNYVFDYVYTVNYKGTAYKMVYEIKSIDLSSIKDQGEYENKEAILNDFATNSFDYTENASNIKGSIINVNEDGTFKQEIDLKVANKNDINKIEEVMYYNVDDSIERIKVQFENHSFECKMGE